MNDLLHHNPRQRNSQLLHDGSLKSRTVHLSVNMCPQNLPFLFQLHAVDLQLFAESEDVLWWHKARELCGNWWHRSY